MKILFSVIAMLAMCSSAVAKAPAVYGDVNGDGVVTTNDVTAIYNYLLNGDETYLLTSDVDKDGVVSSVDITIIYNILLGNK